MFLSEEANQQFILDKPKSDSYDSMYEHSIK